MKSQADYNILHKFKHCLVWHYRQACIYISNNLHSLRILYRQFTLQGHIYITDHLLCGLSTVSYPMLIGRGRYIGVTKKCILQKVIFAKSGTFTYLQGSFSNVSCHSFYLKLVCMYFGVLLKKICHSWLENCLLCEHYYFYVCFLLYLDVLRGMIAVLRVQGFVLMLHMCTLLFDLILSIIRLV